MITTSTTQQTTGKITYDLPLRATVDLDSDEEFRNFTDEERAGALGAFSQLVAAILHKMVLKPDGGLTIHADGDAVLSGETTEGEA